MEDALFAYTGYLAALFHTDATPQCGAGMRCHFDPRTIAGGRIQIMSFSSSYFMMSTITKPRPPLLDWCQTMARRGLCVFESMPILYPIRAVGTLVVKLAACRRTVHRRVRSDVDPKSVSCYYFRTVSLRTHPSIPTTIVSYTIKQK